MTDLSLLLPSIGEWTSLQTLGCWASIVALLTSLYTAIRVRKVRRYVERDRELLEIASLPEIHDYLQQVGAYVRASQLTFLPEELRQRDAALEKITISAGSIVNYYRSAFQVNLASKGALLSVARHHKKNRRIGQAILSYERVLDNHDKYGSLSDQDLSECLHELQICYLTAWQGEEAARIARRAENADMGCCIAEIRVKKLGLPLYVNYTFRLVAGDVMAALARRKPKVNTLRWI